MYICTPVYEKLNYSAVVLRKIIVFVVSYPWPRTKLPPSHYVIPCPIGHRQKIIHKYS